LWKQACTENSLSLNSLLSGAAEGRDFTSPFSNFLHELISLTGFLIIVKRLFLKNQEINLCAIWCVEMH